MEQGGAELCQDQGNPLRPSGWTAPAPTRDRERPVGQRSSVPKIDKLEGLVDEVRYQNQRQSREHKNSSQSVLQQN